MPYIEQKYRDWVDPQIDALVKEMHICAEANKDFSASMRTGILNYVMTKLVTGVAGSNIRYAAVNDIVGAMECCKLELYRRMAAPYEDEKARENGDVYPNRF